jgi:hypothetical protein
METMAAPQNSNRRRHRHIEAPKAGRPITYVAGRDPAAVAREHAARLVAERYQRRSRDHRAK